MIAIRCPVCDNIGAELVTADWEDFLGYLPLGQHMRIGLVCLNCQNTFVLQVTLSQMS